MKLRAGAWWLWGVATFGLVVALPSFLSIGFAIGGMPAEAKGREAWYTWISAVALGLPFWIPTTMACFYFILRKPRGP